MPGQMENPNHLLGGTSRSKTSPWELRIQFKDPRKVKQKEKSGREETGGEEERKVVREGGLGFRLFKVTKPFGDHSICLEKTRLF